MNKPSKNMIPQEDFFAWLREGTKPLQFVGNTKSCTTFVKLPHGENTAYLFSATHYMGTYIGPEIRWNKPFEFCGMYFPETQTLRLTEFDLARAIDHLEADEMKSVEHWCGHISQSVNERIEQKIANDRNNLSIKHASVSDFSGDFDSMISRSTSFMLLNSYPISRGVFSLAILSRSSTVTSHNLRWTL